MIGATSEHNLAERRARNSNDRLKLLIVQPFVTLYDAPLFEAIAKLPGLALTVLADLRSQNQLNQYSATKHTFASHLAQRSIGPVVLRPGLFRAIALIRPDVVILNANSRDVYQTVALCWCRLRGIPVGMWGMFHRIGPRRLVTELYKYLVGTVADVLLSYGKRGREELMRLGIPSDKVVMVSNAIDERAVVAVRDSIPASAVQRFKEDHNLGGKRILLHVVRLTTIKRPDVTLESFKTLLEGRDDVILVWIGGGPLELKIKKRAEELGISPYMRFLGPIYDEHTLALWYLSADVFVIATCIGLSIHHAMCYGVPVVTDDNPNTQASEVEMLADGINGLTYRSGDVNDFASKISRLLDDSDLRLRLSTEARRCAECDFTLHKKIENFEGGIRRLLRLVPKRHRT